MKRFIDFIKNMFTNYLISKTYNSEIKNVGFANQMQIENLFANDGIDL